MRTCMGPAIVTHAMSHAPRLHVRSQGAKRQLSQQSSSGQGGGSAATIRISVLYQLGTSLTTAQQQALQSVVDTAVRVVRKFVKVRCSGMGCWVV